MFNWFDADTTLLQSPPDWCQTEVLNYITSKQDVMDFLVLVHKVRNIKFQDFQVTSKCGDYNNNMIQYVASMSGGSPLPSWMLQ